MLVVFLVGSTPPEYIHDIFVHHTDGVDPVLKKGEFALTVKHHHCSFLGFEFTPFISAENQVLFFEQNSYSRAWNEPAGDCYFPSLYKLVSLRGPPILVV